MWTNALVRRKFRRERALIEKLIAERIRLWLIEPKNTWVVWRQVLWTRHFSRLLCLPLLPLLRDNTSSNASLSFSPGSASNGAHLSCSIPLEDTAKRSQHSSHPTESGLKILLGTASQNSSDTHTNALQLVYEVKHGCHLGDLAQIGVWLGQTRTGWLWRICWVGHKFLSVSEYVVQWSSW